MSKTKILIDCDPGHDDAIAMLVAARHADVLGITEYSDRLGRSMKEAGLDSTYPYRETAPTPPGEELAVYSRYPIVAHDIDTLAGRPAIDVEIDLGGTKVRTILVHTLPPMDWQTSRVWQHELAAIARTASDAVGPTIVFGDFNNTTPVNV